MNGTVITYKEALEKKGSDYKINLALAQGDLYKVARGVYSTSKNANPYLVAAVMNPKAIVTMDSAFFVYGLSDVVPNKVHLATQRNAKRIGDKNVKQYFIEEGLFEPGAQNIPYEGGIIRIYSQERMLVELMRNSAEMPLDYYKEVINSYRRRSETLDIRAIEDYMGLFKRNENMFEILQKEVF